MTHDPIRDRRTTGSGPPSAEGGNAAGGSPGATEAQVWLGLARVAPLPGSDQSRRGLKGGWGLVACRAATEDEGVRALTAELAEGGARLAGFEWFGRQQDLDRELTPYARALVKRLETYPVQFRDFEWHSDDDRG